MEIIKTWWYFIAECKEADTATKKVNVTKLYDETIIDSSIGGYMKFNELPKKWKIVVTILRIMTVVLPIAFILNVWMILGSLIKVMVG